MTNDEQTYVPDGSSNFPDLIRFAVEQHLQAELIAYLGRVWRLTDDQLSSVRAALDEASDESADEPAVLAPVGTS